MVVSLWPREHISGIACPVLFWRRYVTYISGFIGCRHIWAQWRGISHTKSAYTESDSTAVARIRHRNDHRGGRIGPGAEFDIYAVIKVDRRIRWHYTTTIPRLRIGARLTKYRNCKFHNFARTISRHADGISRYSVPPSAGPLLPLPLDHYSCRFPPRHRILPTLRCPVG